MLPLPVPKGCAAALPWRMALVSALHSHLCSKESGQALPMAEAPGKEAREESNKWQALPSESSSFSQSTEKEV